VVSASGTPAVDAETQMAMARPAAPGMPGGVTASEPAAFWAKLAASDHRAAAATATADLLALWGVDPLRADERAGPTLDLWTIANRRGLRYLPTSGNLARLQLLNLPAILELSVPPSGERRFVLLVGLAGDRLHVRFGEAAARLSAEELASAWLGEAHLLWRDFEALSTFLAPGSVGPEVVRLQRLLVRAGAYQGEPSPIYDRATTEAIARFQRSRRLTPDGIVGPLTKIALYAAVAGYDAPSLSGDT
jgi:general secretion pathway protein A